MSLLPAAGMAWSYALKHPKGKPFWMLPHCAAHRVSQKSVLGEIQPFSKAEELATDQRRVCSHELQSFNSSSSASLPDGIQCPCKGQTRNRYL